MIKKILPKTISVSGATSFSYLLTSNNSGVVIENGSDEVENATSVQVDFIIYFPDETSFNTTTFSLVVTTSCRTDTTIFNISNPCGITGSFTHTPNTTNYYNYVTAISSSRDYTVTWNYDEVIFDAVQEDEVKLTLQLKEGQNHPITHEVKMTVTDEIGCTVNYTYITNLCKPSISNGAIIATCVKNNPITVGGFTAKHAGNTIIKYTACSGTTIDWTTLAAVTTPTGVYITNVNSRLYVYTSTTLTTPPSSLQFTVKDNRGIVSNTFTISLTYDLCADSLPTPLVVDENVTLPPGAVSGYVKRIAVEPQIFSPKTMDFSTFTFVAATGQTLVSATELTGVNGSAELNLNREIEYTLGTKTENVELIQFKVADEDGNYSNVAKFTIDAEVLTAPTIVAKTIDVQIGTIKNFNNYLTGSSGVLDLQSIVVTSNPTYGVATPQSDGSINYYTEVAGADEFDISIRDTNGNESADITITINGVHSGELVENPTICGDDVIDLEDYITNFNDGAWSQDAGNPTTVSLADPNNVTMPSASDYGTYIFTYTAGLSTTDVTVTLRREDVLISAITGTGTSRTITFLTYGVSAINNIYAEVDYNSGTLITNFQLDSFDGLTGVVTVLLDDGSGNYDVTINATTICGNTETAVTSFTI